MIRPQVAHIPVPDKRFSELQIDIVGPLPESEGMSYIMTILDTTTRWLEAIPLAEANADQCCKAFIRGWVQHFGLPNTAKSDNGNTFIAKLWKDTHAALGIKVAFTPPYHASSLGGVE